MRLLTRARDGVSILETMVAAAILVIAFASLYALYGQGLGILRITNQSSIAQTILLARADKLRDLGWSVISGSSTGTSVLSVLAIADPTTTYRIANFPKSTEVISGYAYSPPTVSGSLPTYVVTGSNNLAPAISPTTFSTGTNSSLKFVIHLNWTDSQAQVHNREISTVINKTGSL